ncbi:RHS repeat domain-containing protein [Ekhidna sp. MALMAid0563]|uniref:RHS repeat domain-containing protein n=1 Tax=Ekhidna sp. MALMAid0563 TaxID=3143937 RepID=UPI0032DEE9A1
MNSYLKKGSLLILILSFPQIVCSQTQTLKDQFTEYHSQIIPETPQAASFTQYGDIPVDYSTGVPRISIPIHVVEIDGVSVPITLDYHASGIRVNQLATSVGLGWTLNAGGRINRTINELPDEGGWLQNQTDDVESYVNQNGLQHYWVHEDISEFLSNIDHMPDDFDYALSGNNGSFFFNGTAGLTNLEDKIVENDNKALRIIPTFVNNQFEFEFSDLSGSIFKFRTQEFNANFTYVGSEGKPGSVGPSVSEVSREEAAVGWMLDTIETRNNKSIIFDYSEYSFSYTLLQVSQTINQPVWCDYMYPGVTYIEAPGVCGCEGTPSAAALSKQRYEYLTKTSVSYSPRNQLVSKIETERELIKFLYSINEEASVWKKQLDTIKIIDKIHNKEKHFVLNYDIFGGSNQLKLTSIREFGFNGESKPPHIFSYSSGNLPALNSNSQDYRGYYNGKSNSSPIRLDAQSYMSVEDPDNRNLLSFKEVSSSHLVRGTLTSITYPSGGRVDFNYEPNIEYSNSGGNTEFSQRQITVTNSLYDSLYTEDGYTVHCYFFETSNMLSKLSSTTGVIPSYFNYSGFTDLCEEDEYNIDCPRWRIYDIDNESYSTEKSVFANGGDNLADFGRFRLELRIETSELPLSTNSTSVTLSWVEDTEALHDYAGGLRVSRIKKLDNDLSIVGDTRYSYQGLETEDINSGSYYISEGDPTYPKRMFSSDPLDASYLVKRVGHLYKSVTIEQIAAQDTLVSKYYYSDRGSRANYTAKIDSLSLLSDGQKVQLQIQVHESEIVDEIEFRIVGKKNQCIDYINPVMSSANELGYDYPYYRRYYSTEFRTPELTTIDYFNGKVIAKTTNKFFNQNQLDSVSITTDSKGKVIRTEFFYPNDFSELSTVTNKNILNIPVITKIYSDNNLIAGQALELDNNGNVTKVYKYNQGRGTNSSSFSYVPDDFELVQEFGIEDGKPISSVDNAGIKTTYIWGYGGKYPIAKIVNSDPSIVASQLNVNTEDLTNLGSGYLSAVNSLRNSLSHSSITTFDYSETGLKEIKDANGRSTHYKRDGLGRLVKVLDDQLHLLTSYRYFYYSSSPIHH